MCWPRQMDEQDFPEHPQAPGFFWGPRPICFYGWETLQSTQTPPHEYTPIAGNAPAITLCLYKNVNTPRKQDLQMKDIHFIVPSDTNCTHCLQIQKEITEFFRPNTGAVTIKIKCIGSNVRHASTTGRGLPVKLKSGEELSTGACLQLSFKTTIYR